MSYRHGSVPGSLKPRSALAHDIQADITIVGADVDHATQMVRFDQDLVMEMVALAPGANANIGAGHARDKGQKSPAWPAPAYFYLACTASTE